MKAVHYVHQPGEKVVTLLADGTSFGRLELAAAKAGVSSGQLCELLGFLNSIGALGRKRQASQQFRAWSVQALHLIVAARYMPLAWRREATASFVLAGIIRATWPIALAATGLCALVVAGAFMSAGLAIALTSYGLVLFACSLLVHELAHIVLIRHQRVAAQVLQAGLRLGIIHPKLSADAEARSALAGPAAGSALCALAAFPSLLLPTDLFALLGMLIAAFHTLSLLPWYGDGASFHKALRQRRGQTR